MRKRTKHRVLAHPEDMVYMVLGDVDPVYNMHDENDLAVL